MGSEDGRRALEGDPSGAGAAGPRPSPWRSAGRWASLGLYNLVFLAALVAYSPVLAWKFLRNPRLRKGVASRFGLVSRRPGEAPAFWVHGVSVGEVKAGGSFIAVLQEAFPGHEVVVSSTTATGIDLAARLHRGKQVVHYPLDFGPFPAWSLAGIRPRCVFLMELELWPNFLEAAKRQGTLVAVINGRISRRSFRGYRVARWILPQLTEIDLFCVQNATYAGRLASLGVPSHKIALTGNLKYDAVMVRPEGLPDPDLAAVLDVARGQRVLVGGSTHGEEDLILHRTARTARRRIGLPIRLVLAPRHPERVPGVLEDIRSDGGRGVRWSRLKSGDEALGDPAATVVVDTIGDLERFYGLADLVFVGGSMAEGRGGQNMLEPAALGRATLFGPHVQNFQADVDLLLEHAGAAMVRDAAELLERVCVLLADPVAAKEMGARGADVIRGNQGATARTLEAVKALLEGGDRRAAGPGGA